MSKSNFPEVRQLERLLREKLIPLAQNGAPLILFDAPPRSSHELETPQQMASPLLPLKKDTSYPQVHNWPDVGVNAISVPVIGCIFEGETDYDVRDSAGSKGQRWIVPVRQGTLFLVKPGIPFTSNKMAWERSAPHEAYARGVLIHLRHDGVRCHTFTMDKGKLWAHPYLFLYQSDALPLGEKLLDEMLQMDGSVSPIAYYYWLLIFHLLLRSIEQGRFATTASRVPGYEEGGDSQPFSSYLTSEGRIRLAEEYIRHHLGDLNLRNAKIAEHCGLSTRHLARLFLTEKKMLLSHYIQEQRLQKACELLKSSYLPIGEVAAYCGFKRLSNFSNWFTRHKNCPPSAYRDNSLKD